MSALVRHIPLKLDAENNYRKAFDELYGEGYMNHMEQITAMHKDSAFSARITQDQAISMIDQNIVELESLALHRFKMGDFDGFSTAHTAIYRNALTAQTKLRSSLVGDDHEHAN